VAVGTDLFQIIFSSAYGTIRHTLSGNVFIFGSFVMILASAAGTQFGAIVTRYVRGISVRYVLGVSILVSSVGVALKLASVLSISSKALLENMSLVVIIGTLVITALIVLSLFIIALRHRRGMPIPVWMESLIGDAHGESKQSN
jgi:uncharacterized membrane protein YfcA